MLKKILSKLFYPLFVVIVVLFLLEDAAQIYVRNFKPELYQKYSSRGFQLPQGYAGNFKPSSEFGYVFTDGNNYGFHTKGDFPLYRGPNTYVIAVLGGSVAYHFINFIYNNDPDGFAQKIKNAIPALKQKEIQFVSFAIPGYKQPQQFYVLSHFIDQVDMIIQLDGWNEVSSTNPNEFPADFAMNMNKKLTKEDQDKFDSAKRKKALIHFFEENKLLNKSMAIYLLKNSLEIKMISELQELYAKSPDPESRKISDLVYIWSKYLNLERDLLKEKNKKGFFFVQASQYNPDSKVFTAEEKQIAFNPTIAKFAGSGFQLLRAEAKKIKVFDLADVFKNESGSIYIDDCCHVNLKGNKILSEEVLKIVSKNFNN